jgi:uncharacterized OsmC-like protein
MLKKFPLHFLSTSSKATQSYSLQLLSSPQSRSTTTSQTSTNHLIHTDLPVSLGGKNLFPQPVELLLASLGSCKEVTLRYILRNMSPRIIPVEIAVNVEGYRIKSGALQLPIDIVACDEPSYLKEIRVDVVFSTREGVSEENIRVIKEQVEMRCPVASMIKCSNTRLICGVRNEVIEDAVVEDAVIEDAVIRDA